MNVSIDIHSNGMTNEAARRNREFACLTLAGIAGDLWCGLSHVCRCGHLGHPEFQPARWLAYDFIWIACLVGAALCALRSDVRGRVLAFTFFLFLLFSRFLIGSGGGLLFLFAELPMLIYLGVQSLWIIVRALKQWSAFGTGGVE